MSYILDALKKAEAERERGQVPGLHAATATPKLEEPFEGHRLPSWAWAALGALMTLVAALVWTLVERDPTAGPAPLPVSAQGLPPVDTAAQREQLPAVPEPMTPQADAAMPITTAHPSVQTHRTPITAAARLRDKDIGDQTLAKPAKVLNDQRIHALNDLPDEIRQGIPALSFGGAMYSDQPASRMLLINGQAFHEGDKVTENLTLREIKLRSAVLVFKGYAYAVNY